MQCVPFYRCENHSRSTQQLSVTIIHEVFKIATELLSVYYIGSSEQVNGGVLLDTVTDYGPLHLVLGVLVILILNTLCLDLNMQIRKVKRVGASQVKGRGAVCGVLLGLLEILGRGAVRWIWLGGFLC